MTNLDRSISILACAGRIVLIIGVTFGLAITANKAITKLAAYQLEAGK